MGTGLQGKHFEITPDVADIAIDRLASDVYSFSMLAFPYLIQMGHAGYPTADKVFSEVASGEEAAVIKVLKNTGDAFIDSVDSTIEAIKAAENLSPEEKGKLLRNLHIQGKVYAVITNPEALVGESVAYNFLDRSEFIVEATLVFEPAFTDCADPDAKASGFLSIRGISLIFCAPHRDTTEAKSKDMQLIKEHHSLPCK